MEKQIDLSIVFDNLSHLGELMAERISASNYSASEKHAFKLYFNLIIETREALSNATNCDKTIKK